MAQLKTCFKCLQKKSADDFYKHPRMADGRLGKCKDCTRADTIANRHAKLDQYREYDRNRANDPRRVVARKQYAESPAGKAAARSASRSYDHNHPRRKAATSAVGNAVRDGRMKRQPCEVCGEARAQAHHDDYDKPLDVRWLCVPHHAEHHKNLREEQRRKTKAA